MILNSLHILDPEFWRKSSDQVVRVLHRYKGRDIAYLLHIFDVDILDDEGEVILTNKTSDEFFDRMVSLLPMQVKHMNREEILRCIEILVKRNLGQTRVFRDFLLFKLEQNNSILRFSIEQYKRLIYALADLQYIEDLVFWNEFVFKFLDLTHKGTERKLTPSQA